MVYKQLLTFFFSIIIKPFWEMSMIKHIVEAWSRQTIDSYTWQIIFHKFVGTDICCGHSWQFLMRLFLIVFISISELYRIDRN